MSDLVTMALWAGNWLVLAGVLGLIWRECRMARAGLGRYSR